MKQRLMVLAREKASQIWCRKNTSNIQIDSRLCEEIAKIIYSYFCTIKQLNKDIEQLRIQ